MDSVSFTPAEDWKTSGKQNAIGWKGMKRDFDGDLHHELVSLFMVEEDLHGVKIIYFGLDIPNSNMN